MILGLLSLFSFTDIVAYHPIRLVDINTNEINNQSGRVEIYNKGQWGNICENSDYSEVRIRDKHDDVTSYSEV